MIVRRCCRRRVLIKLKLRTNPLPSRRPTNATLNYYCSPLACFSVAAFAGDNAAPAAPTVSTNDHGDAVLKAMLAELKRSQEKLQLGQMQRPYYIDYQVTEIQDNILDATLGALRTDQVNTGRLVRVVVRIGDYKQDSYFGEGMGALETMPSDNNEMALRRQLWLATDKAYKSALSGLTEKQAALKSMETENDLADFSEEKPAQSVRDLAKLDVDLDKWKQTLRTTSDLFRGDPSLEMSSAMLNFRVLNRYFVNTEGTVTRNGRAIYTVFFPALTRRMTACTLSVATAGSCLNRDELPKPEEIEKEAKQLIGTFNGLKKAPLVEDDYRGPVLFSADAATSLFERLIVPNILGVRPDLGNPARTNGEFASYYKGRVLPETFTVVDDPKAKEFDHQTLAGTYDVDDEGVEAQKVTVIDKGVLTNFLLGREPIRDFPHSNGHGRTALAGAPRPQISNLIFKAADSIPFEDTEEKADSDVQGPGTPLRLLRGDHGSAAFTAAFVARLRERWTHGTGARSGVQTTGYARAAQ